jgi:transcription elongation factor Elf1
MSERAFECISCRAAIDVSSFLAGLTGFHNDTNTATAKCPACGASIAFQVRSGSLEIGYTYWAGSLHFEGLLSVRVPGIRVIPEGESRAIEAGGVVYRPRPE